MRHVGVLALALLILAAGCGGRKCSIEGVYRVEGNEGYTITFHNDDTCSEKCVAASDRGFNFEFTYECKVEGRTLYVKYLRGVLEGHKDKSNGQDETWKSYGEVSQDGSTLLDWHGMDVTME